MEHRIFYGELLPEELAQTLLVHFNRGNLTVQKLGTGNQLAIQIKTRDNKTSGGETALCVIFKQVEDGVSVQVGQQTWLGIAASLGLSALSALRNPMSLLHRIDDIAQDIEYMQLTDEVWQVLESNARAIGSGYALSERLERISCAYCLSANPAREPNCIACGAPMGNSQPTTCPTCGFVLTQEDTFCPNCKNNLI
jgi:hypothetical protein